MTLRNARRRNLDDKSFPLRLKVRVPPEGLGQVLRDALQWLDAEVGRTAYAHHPAKTLGGYAAAFYFRRPEDLAAFLAAFPQFELADATALPGRIAPLPAKVPRY